MDDFEVAVIGGGVIGLACAAVIAEQGRQVVVLERHRRIGQETTSRNSGVIHAGLYYPTGSLKAELCVEGRKWLYERCQRQGVPHRKCGKILVATDDAERAKLEQIFAQAQTNGAGDVRLLEADEVHRLEPKVHAIAGLLSPETGIVDVHALCESYRRDAEAAGAAIAFDSAVTGLFPEGQGWRVETQKETLTVRWVVNAAGLEASRLAALAGLDVDALGLRQKPCKGDYFRISARHAGMVSHLVYPVPVHAGLGIHITFDLGGKLLAGPDTEYIGALRYDVDPAKAAMFGAALRRYLPHIRDEDLEPDYAGIRPKLQGPGEPVRDFVLESSLPGLVNLLGIESPGVTASEAIARRVAALIA